MGGGIDNTQTEKGNGRARVCVCVEVIDKKRADENGKNIPSPKFAVEFPNAESFGKGCSSAGVKDVVNHRGCEKGARRSRGVGGVYGITLK